MSSANGTGEDATGCADADLDAGRQDFCAAALEWRDIITSGPWRRPPADPAIDRMHELSGRWAQRGRVRDLLAPLLAETEDPHVRVCAARHLYVRGVDEVEPLLRELAEHPDQSVTRPALVVLNHRPSTSPRTP